MSKAFLRESDFADTPDLPPPESPLPPGVKNYLTAEGAARLRAELERRINRQRPPLATASRDPEIKRELHALDQRIRYLQESLRTAEIVSPTENPDGVVRFGSTVDVREPNGERSRYRLVGVDETDPSRGGISWLSPLARALANARRGDHITFTTPSGERSLEILAVE